MMQKSVLMAATLCSVIGSGSMTDIVEHPVFHIVEEPGAIDHMADCEVPTEEYYDALKEDMSRRHPKASKFMLEHLSCLETFLDTSIIAGFSFGIVKAQIAVTEGNLLGHRVKRSGISHDPEKTQAIRDFAILTEPSHVRQFLGSTNWIRLFMPAPYAAAVKILGEWNKPGGESKFGNGIGHPNGTTKGDKVVRVIKLMAQNCIERAVMDEAGAIDGSRPLEQIADACGYAWGGTIVQMTEDLSRFKVLMMVSKGFTPAQQAWAPLVLEAFAQLGCKRAQRRILGPMKSICWTDHANMTKQQSVPSEEIDIKLLRWTSELLADGSEVRSLSGRAARLGDGTSRNPGNRDQLLLQRGKDLKGIIGQVRGFNVDGYLSDYEQPGRALPWAVGDHGWVQSQPSPPSAERAAPVSAGAKGQHLDFVNKD